MRWITTLAPLAVIGAASFVSVGGCAWLLDLSPGILGEDAGAPGAGGGGSAPSTGGSGGASDGGTPCEASADCEAPQFPECRKVACVEGECAINDAPAGKVLTAQIPGDCLELRCDGHGSILASYANDPKNDNNPCTYDQCNDGVASNPSKPESSSCQQGSASMCDGSGHCVECLDATYCDGDLCIGGLCVPSECGDGMQDGAETDVDCGGGACPPCGACGKCGNDADCNSDHDLMCSAGVCGPCADAGSG